MKAQNSLWSRFFCPQLRRNLTEQLSEWNYASIVGVVVHLSIAQLTHLAIFHAHMHWCHYFFFVQFPAITNGICMIRSSKTQNLPLYDSCTITRNIKFWRKFAVFNFELLKVDFWSSHFKSLVVSSACCFCTYRECSNASYSIHFAVHIALQRRKSRYDSLGTSHSNASFLDIARLIWLSSWTFSLLHIQ